MGHPTEPEEREVSPGMSLYLGELYRLGGHNDNVSTSALAEVLDVTPAAVARMVSRLDEQALVAREPYRGVRLTAAGEREALRIIRYHRLSEAFLVRVLSYGWHEAHDLADALAEIADETFADRIDAAAGYPKRCPHGEPIPSRDGVMPVVNDIPLLELEVGQSGTISRVRTREEDRLKYFAKMGLVPGSSFKVQGRAPFRGPIRLQLAGAECVLGSELAQDLRVELEPA